MAFARFNQSLTSFRSQFLASTRLHDLRDGVEIGWRERDSHPVIAVLLDLAAVQRGELIGNFPLSVRAGCQAIAAPEKDVAVFAAHDLEVNFVSSRTVLFFYLMVRLFMADSVILAESFAKTDRWFRGGFRNLSGVRRHLCRILSDVRLLGAAAILAGRNYWLELLVPSPRIRAIHGYRSRWVT